MKLVLDSLGTTRSQDFLERHQFVGRYFVDSISASVQLSRPIFVAISIMPTILGEIDRGEGSYILVSSL